MIKRCFVGREHPLLPEAVRLLFDRHAKDGIWDMSGVIVALPGAQAARRLSRLLQDQAKPTQIALEGPEILTPATLLEKLYTPAQKIAGPLQSYFAWIQAAAGMPEDERKTLAPKADNTDRPMTWAGVAREAQRARAAAAAEGLTLSEISQKCGALPGVCDDRRWPALANLERSYLAKLAEVGLTDRDDARMEALKSKGVSCQNDIYLIGAQDLNGIERDMLQAVESSVNAVIPALSTEEHMFDEAGSVRVNCSDDITIPIPDNVLRFVDGPAEEADALVEDIAALGGCFALEEITIGIGDEAAAESMARRLGVLDIPSYSPFGRPLSRVRPAALLNLVRDYLHSPTAASFAALARHPDIEAYLTRGQDIRLQDTIAAQPARDAKKSERVAKVLALPLLAQLDIYRAECLPENLPAGPKAPKLKDIEYPSDAQIAREGVLAAHDGAIALLSELRGEDKRKPIGQWADPIAGLLGAVYRDTSLPDDPEGRQFARALAGLRDILLGLQDLPPGLSPDVSGAEALAFVLSQAEAERLPSEPAAASQGGLEMMGWLELALDDAPVLLLTGLQEGCVPAVTGDDSLLPDSLRAKLGLADDRRREVRDKWLLRQMIESRQGEGRHVHLIVPRRGADGDPRMPSRLLFACSAEEAAKRASAFSTRQSDEKTALPLFSCGEKRDLTPPLPVKRDPPISEMTISGFTSYLACPYRFYLRHVCCLEERDDSQDEINPRLFGLLLHSCLAAFAKSRYSQSADAAEIGEYFRRQLEKQVEKQFGRHPSRVLRLQIRQAHRRLEAFSQWQAQSVLEGWVIYKSEEDLKVAIDVDGLPFTVRGRLDRMDYHPATGRYRIIDYKTGDSAKRPEDKHCPRGPAEKWLELQLPLYRLLVGANGVDIAKIAPGDLGYVLLSADLEPATLAANGALNGGTGWVPARWGEEEMDVALESAKEVIRKVRAGEFWPPADPPPYPPSRTDPGRVDSYSDLCLDACSDRVDWFGTAEETL